LFQKFYPTPSNHTTTTPRPHKIFRSALKTSTLVGRPEPEEEESKTRTRRRRSRRRKRRRKTKQSKRNTNGDEEEQTGADLDTVVRRADRLLIEPPPPPCLHREEKDLDLGEMESGSEVFRERLESFF
jgi:hypothetical protein